MSQLSKVKEAQEIFREYQELTDGYEMIWWERAERIYKLRYKKLFKYVFGTDDMNEPVVKAFNTFCGEIDLANKVGSKEGLNIPPTTAYYMADTYKKWIVELGYAKSDMVGYSRRKLHKASLPKYGITKEDSEEVLQRALPVVKGGLSSSDFKTWLEDKFIEEE